MNLNTKNWHKTHFWQIFSTYFDFLPFPRFRVSSNVYFGRLTACNNAKYKNEHNYKSWEQEYFKGSQVVFADAFTNPYTVVIHFLNTDITIIAMFGQIGF